MHDLPRQVLQATQASACTDECRRSIYYSKRFVGPLHNGYQRDLLVKIPYLRYIENRCELMSSRWQLHVRTKNPIRIQAVPMPKYRNVCIRTLFRNA
jgi:hypothetical protein